MLCHDGLSVLRLRIVHQGLYITEDFNITVNFRLVK